MDAETKQAYRTIQIKHQQRNDISGQEISLIRHSDNYITPEEFYYIALLGQTQAPSSVSANNANLSAISTLTALAGSSTNCYYYSADQQTVFIKIFDTDSSMMLLVSGLQPLS